MQATRALKLLATCTFVTILLHTDVFAAGGNVTQNYEASIKTSELGNYSIDLESHEIPSNEYLPIIGKEYFPYSTASFTTEVDNTRPSALYHTKSVGKVDVVFAIGDTSQSEALQNFIPTFKTKLETAGNFIDANVELVKTSTIDMASFGAREIFNTWRKMPVGDGFGAKVWKLAEAEGKVYCEGNKKLSSGAHRSSMIIADSEEDFKTTDFTMEFTHNTRGPAGETNYRNVYNGWSPHISGAIFRYTENSSGVWDAYMLVIADCSTAYSSGTGRPYCAIIKIKGGDADLLPGSYAGTLPIGWSAGVIDTSGALSDMRIDHQGLTYHRGVWCKGERNSKSDMLLLGARAIVNTSSHNFKIECKGNNIKVYCGDKLQLDLDDNYGIPGNNSPTPYMQGTFGFYSFSSPNIYFSNVKITKGERKSLGDAIQNVSWRDGSAHIIIHAADTVPDDFIDEQSPEYAYTLSKLLNTNAYLVNIGTYENKTELMGMGDKLTTASGEIKQLYLDSKSPDIVQALIKTEEWIEELMRQVSKPVDWVLVNEKVIWETTYNDAERDLPLNFGGNKDDIKIQQAWGVTLTNYYTEDKILAEKWRYRHFPQFFDNSVTLESFHNIWIEDPVEIFPNPGKYRVNYKRRDNPFYENAMITYIFDNYRYFSTDYDRRQVSGGNA